MTDPYKSDLKESGVATLDKPKVRPPSLYKVILLNDDYTTMEFVILVLESIFNKKADEAHKIMMHVHTSGRGVCGLYPFGIAETKVAMVKDLALKNEMPLQCSLEKE